ncbi:hypothetical protein LEMLEM_LOCUS17904 [Lemmus lemmus]
MTSMVAKKLIKEILPRHNFPAMIRFDNGPAFISQTSAQDLGAQMEGFVGCSDDYDNDPQSGQHHHLSTLLPHLSS